MFLHFFCLSFSECPLANVKHKTTTKETENFDILINLFSVAARGSLPNCCKNETANCFDHNLCSKSYLQLLEFPIIFKYLVKELFKLGNYAPKNVFFFYPQTVGLVTGTQVD